MECVAWISKFKNGQKVWEQLVGKVEGHPGIGDWLVENTEAIAIGLGAGLVAYFEGNPEAATLAQQKARDVLNSVFASGNKLFSAKYGVRIVRDTDFDTIGVAIAATSEDSIVASSMVTTPPESRASAVEQTESVFAVTYLMDVESLRSGMYPFVLAAQDKGMKWNVGITCELDVLLEGSPAAVESASVAIDVIARDFQGIDASVVYIRKTDGRLLRRLGKGAGYLVDENVRDFQAIGRELVYVLGMDGNLWRENGDMNNRELVDSGVVAFQGMNEILVYVLGMDGNLWREHGNMSCRSLVDGNVRTFQAMNDSLVYVLGSDANLWREQIDMNHRDVVDGNVLRFQAIDSRIVYVLGTDGQLWREIGDMSNRELVDGNVRAFQGMNGSLVYVLGNDGNLWRERGTFGDRDAVDGNVLSFHAIDDKLIYVLGTDQNLWRERGNMNDRDFVDVR